MLLLKDECVRYEKFLIIDRIRDALIDYKYLLNRGYNAITSLNLVSGRYGLSKMERLVLYRSIHNDKIVADIKKKTVDTRDLSINTLVIDGYNVLITLTAAFRCKQLIKGDDGFIRDVLGVFGRVRYDLVLFKALYYLAYSLSLLNVEKVIIVLDRNVKWSKLFSETMYKELSVYVPHISIILAHKSDKKIISLEDIVSSSDIVVLMLAKKVFDLAGYIIERYIKYNNIIDINKIIIM